MRAVLRILAVLALAFGGLTGGEATAQGGDHYIVIVKNEQRLYLGQGDPKAPRKSDVLKQFPVTTGALWTQKGLETPSGVYTVVEKTNNPVQGGYDFSDTGDVTLTPYFMRLNVPNRGGIGIHTYTGRTLDIWRFGVPGGQTTHGCVAGPPGPIIDLYKNYVELNKTRVWVVDDASEAFRDAPSLEKPTATEVDGRAWRSVPTPTKQQFYAVDMVRPDLGYAVSGDATFNGRKYAWKSEIYRWDGRRWSREATLPYWLHGIDMLNEDEGWAVGQNYMAGVHRKNGRWTKEDRELPRVPYMSGVVALNAGDAWTAGGGGEFFTWNGSEWVYSQQPEVTRTMRSISMPNTRSGWAVGGGWDTAVETKDTVPMIASFDGKDWTLDESPVQELWYGVDAVSPSEAWAVGSNGAIIHYTGGAWKPVESPTKERLHAIDMRSRTDGWIVGDEKGVALHWDGKRWSKVRLPVEEKFYDVSVLPDGGAMAVGGGGATVQLVDAAQAPALQGEAEPTAEPDEPVATPDAASQPDEPYATAEGVQTVGVATAVPAEAEATTAEPVGEDASGEAVASTEAADGATTVARADTPARVAAPDSAEAAAEAGGGGFPTVPVLGAGLVALLAGGGLLAFRRR